MTAVVEGGGLQNVLSLCDDGEGSGGGPCFTPPPPPYLSLVVVVGLYRCVEVGARVVQVYPRPGG